jgi:signal transduction histidine kinase/DNA-binding NarL/FixJ family response regulator
VTRILVVDDHATNRDFLRTLLAYRGYEIEEASDGAEALALARRARPDLIITDILMPTMDGYEFVRQLRLDPDIAATAVIFCTADYHEREAHRLAAACGVANVLIKPCEPDLVLRTVESALGLAAESPSPPPSQQFDRDHLTLLTNKLSQKTGELQIVNQRLAALIEISLRSTAEPDSARLLDDVCRSARELIGARYAMIAASDGAVERPEHFFTSGVDAETAHRMGIPPLREGVLAKLLEERGTLRRRDLPQPAGAAGLPASFPPLRSLLIVPILSQREIYGWLCLGDKVGGEEFSEEDERLATILGAQAGRVYENVTLYAKAQQHAADLEREAAERRQTQHELQAQLGRLDLLNRITRAIGERQDLLSIFQVVIRKLEDNLPLDFGCIGLYEPTERSLTLVSIGARSNALATEVGIAVHAPIPIDPNGLSQCVQGQLTYEPNIDQAPFAFYQRLARGGLRALVMAPLLAESKVFGVLMAARRQAESFSSGDCEFLRQLSEHVALATHQAQLHDALQRAYDDLRQSQQAIMQQERLRALGQMASGVAHDINNAISPIALYTESLLELETNLSDRARSYLRTIQRAIDDVAQTVSRMREFYRPREPQLTAVRVRLNSLVEQVIEFTRVRWKDLPQERGIVIDLLVHADPALPDIAGVESEIRDALTNLVFNAVDAMPEGGTLTIRTRRAASPSEGSATTVYLEVSDTGVGMDEETQRRCLEPFFTTKGERGTGLGLAMVFGMTQRHGAEMELESAPGKGTTVRVAFQAARAAPEPATGPALAMPKHPLSILLVDDDPLIIQSMRATLEGDGHRVTVADGGQAGIDTFVAAQRGGETFAVVITDLGMPYVDGRKVAATVKATSPATPVVLLTGWGQRLTDDNDIPAHIDRVLAKPPKLAQVRRILAELTSPAPLE